MKSFVVDNNFNKLRDFLLKESGITLRDNQAYQMKTRLMPFLEKKGFELDELLEKAAHDFPLKQQIIELFTTNETFFFRNSNVFNFIRTELFPALIEKNRPKRKLRILSAASSSGQEAYSLAIILYDSFPEIRGWDVVIQGIDIDEKMIEKAKEGWYSQLEVNRGVPLKSLFKHFERKGRGFQVKRHLKSMVVFQHRNLLEACEKGRCFDMILCRNVLIYFAEEAKEQVLLHLAKKLNDGGVLMLGASEIGRNIPKQYLSSHRKGSIVWYQTII